jgi:hydroxymethylglutaryl-CoA synthase
VYGEKAADAADVQRQIGNTYTGSLWMGVAGLVEARGASLVGRRLLLFSYGAGAMASMLGLVGRAPSSSSLLQQQQQQQQQQQAHAQPGLPGVVVVVHPTRTPYTLERMAAAMSLRRTLFEQRVCTPAEYDAASDAVVEGYRRAEAMPPGAGPQHMWPGAYFVEAVDGRGRRSYARHA